MLENLENMSIQELEKLQAHIKELIKVKKAKTEPQLILYTHNCKDSANYHKRKYKHWAKLVTGVDVTKTNGYAFQGEFLNIDREHKVPVGSIIVSVCDTTIVAYEITSSSKVEIGKAKTNSMSDLIEQLAERF